MPDVTAESTPWGDPAWRERALAWVRERLAAHGVTMLGRDEPRLRPWSITMRLRTGQGPVWFKANPPGSRFEPALTSSLSQWVPEQVLTPLAIDAEEGWSLLPDGGTVLREALGAAPDPAVWEGLLRQYAVLQRAVAPHVPELLRVGVPDLRASTLPARFDDLVATGPVRAQVGAPGGISAEQYALLSSARPRLREWCARLAAIPVSDTLDHADLHEGQAFVADNGRFVFFDWGDAAIGHPFASLLVAFRIVTQRFGPHGANLDRLRDAYLEPWTAEHPVAELRAAVELAVRLGGVARAMSWGRIFPESEHLLDTEHGQSISHWLLRVLTPDLVTSRTL